ncbi:MAG TPA: sigma-70 family RNA polymerase sigma factor [Vicinamibacterales bacterium]|nr:sigma-70 family RNA polymerase sigma factor [Vicinamibacterales bacterium]
MPDGGEVTQLLAQASSGDAVARATLFDVLYRELRRLAEGAMRAERANHTLQPTALVHEAFLRLAGNQGRFENRAHFLGVAASAMRRVLVDHARGRNAHKRGHGATLVTVNDLDALPQAAAEEVDLVVLDDALSRLAALDARQGQIVELRFFGGLSVEETAALIGVSERTIKREWQMSRAWLRREMSRPAAESPATD